MKSFKQLYTEGLWANINKKKKRGGKSASKGSKAYKAAKKAGDKLHATKENVQESDCEPAVQDDELNVKNKGEAALDREIAYMHPEDAQKIVEFAEQGRLCGNCMAFDISEEMKSCGVDVESGFGYCTGYDFMCHEDKTCLSHGEGGPKTE